MLDPSLTTMGFQRQDTRRSGSRRRLLLDHVPEESGCRTFDCPHPRCWDDLENVSIAGALWDRLLQGKVLSMRASEDLSELWEWRNVYTVEGLLERFNLPPIIYANQEPELLERRWAGGAAVFEVRFKPELSQEYVVEELRVRHAVEQPRVQNADRNFDE